MISLAVNWTASPEIFEFSFLTLRWYGLLFAGGFAASYFVLQKVFNKEGISIELLDKLTIYMVFSTVIGARLGHCLFYDWEYYSKNIIEILFIWQGGLASHGAAIGILTGLWLYTRNVSKNSYLWAVDRVVIVAALTGAFIRIGNLFNSEIYGKPTEVAWAFIFPLSDPEKLPRHPTQIYESLFCVFLFWILYRYYKTNATKLKDGIITGLFLSLLFTFRFFVEFFKDVQVDFEKTMQLNMGQWLSIPFVLLGLALLFYSSKKEEINYIKRTKN